MPDGNARIGSGRFGVVDRLLPCVLPGDYVGYRGGQGVTTARARHLVVHLPVADEERPVAAVVYPPQPYHQIVDLVVVRLQILRRKHVVGGWVSGGGVGVDAVLAGVPKEQRL